MKSKLPLLIKSFFLVFLVSYIGGLTTRHSVTSWYLEIKKSPLTPPSMAFPIVWTILYFMIGFALYELLKLKEQKKLKGKKLKFFYLQLFLNFLWSPVFFGLKNPHLGFIVVVPLWLMIIQNMFYYKKVSKKVSLLLLPYLLWVTFAIYLNLYIVINN